MNQAVAGVQIAPAVLESIQRLAALEPSRTATPAAPAISQAAAAAAAAASGRQQPTGYTGGLGASYADTPYGGLHAAGTTPASMRGTGRWRRRSRLHRRSRSKKYWNTWCVLSVVMFVCLLC